MIRAPSGVTAVCVDQILGYVVAATMDCWLRVYDISSEEVVVQENGGHTDVVTCLVHMKDTNQYISASWDKTIRVWAGPRENGKIEPQQVESETLRYSKTIF